MPKHWIESEDKILRKHMNYGNLGLKYHYYYLEEMQKQFKEDGIIINFLGKSLIKNKLFNKKFNKK